MRMPTFTPAVCLIGLSFCLVAVIEVRAQVVTITKAQPAVPASSGQVSGASISTQQATPSEALIGKPPPPIKVAKWVKGEPLANFEKGRVYVVDLWATWCGPCKAAIPHLTKLARENKGKVEVIGVSILEAQKNPSDSTYIEGVEKFVAKMGDRMDYRVASDTPDKQMCDTWFKPAGTAGIPTAWIIDQQGLVAWIGIGDPNDVERIVGQVLAGTFDLNKEKEFQRLAEEGARKRSEADIAAAKGKTGVGPYAKFPGYEEALKRGEQSAALASLDAAFKADPASELPGAYQWKFMALMRRNNTNEINQYSRELMERYPDNGDVIGFVSSGIVPLSSEPARFDKDLFLHSAKRAAELAKPDTRWAQFAKFHLGWAYYHTGDTAKAIENVQAALDGIKQLNGRFNFNGLDDQCEDALKEFRKVSK